MWNADPDPDPAFVLDVDHEPTLYFNVDPDPYPDPARHQSDAICKHGATEHPKASTPSLWASTALHGSLKLLNFNFHPNPDPDPAFHSKAVPDSDPVSKNNADPIRIRNRASTVYSVRYR